MELILFIDGLTADYKCVAHDTGVSDNVRTGARGGRGVCCPGQAGLSARMTVTQVRREAGRQSDSGVHY